MENNNNGMGWKVTQASATDLPFIYLLFEEAIRFQQKNHYIGWKGYDKAFIQSDIQKGLLYKIAKGEDILCIFCICYSDELIWREKEKGDALYLHRVVLNQLFKGEKAFQKVLDWAIAFAIEKKLSYLRMDTWADNEKIISYYKSYGFSVVEDFTTADSPDLPEQHRNLHVILLELAISSVEVNKEKINILQELSTIENYWRQKVIGNANGQLIKLAKGIGEINWHTHEDQDELFILFKGQLTIQLRNKNIELSPYELFIVPKGTAHCPRSEVGAEFLIMGLGITSNAAGGRPDNWSFPGSNHQ